MELTLALRKPEVLNGVIFLNDYDSGLYDLSWKFQEIFEIYIVKKNDDMMDIYLFRAHMISFFFVKVTAIFHNISVKY